LIEVKFKLVLGYVNDSNKKPLHINTIHSLKVCLC